MAERWLTIAVEPEPEQPVRPGPPERVPVTARRPITLVPTPPRRRRPAWSVVASGVVAAGILAGLLGASLMAASGARWNEIAREATTVGQDLSARSQTAAAALSDELAGLESTASTLGDVSAALDAAARIAADLEATANGDPLNGPERVETLVSEIDRLAGAIDAAYPGLSELGVAGPDGPGDALQAAGAALVAVSDALSALPSPGFGPVVLQHPLPGFTITDPFGTEREEGFHQGIDLGAPAGTPILAADDGTVLQSGWLGDGPGNGVILRHAMGWETRYFHMDSADLPLAVGEEVLAGQVIGYVGSTGNSTGPHLHFEIVFGPIRMDPQSFIYVGTRLATGGPTGDLPLIDPAVTDPAGEPEASAGAGSVAATEAPEVPAGIADVQRELLDIGTEASDQAAAFEERRAAEQDRHRTATWILYGGAALLATGLLMMAVRPRMRFAA